ncbi:MAG: DUF3843 family protein [Muribaculaceae bacterium]|nr:DUF3843 family protein [Muribaculaceae bacterium]
MEKITEREFLLRQPDFPQKSEMDSFYIGIANLLLETIGNSEFGAVMPLGLTKRVALTLADYLQDIVADAGFWRSFIDANRELYGWSIPFHDSSEAYVDYELNKEDVRFLVWYVVAMLWEECGMLYPHDKKLLQMADSCFAILENEYDDAPVNESFNIARGLEFNDPEDAEKIYHLGNWLFLHSYLLTPAFALSLQEVMSEYDPSLPDADTLLNNKLEEAMLENTTGPLALYTPEWVYLIIKRHLPDSAIKEPMAGDGKTHPYYEAFIKATGGKNIAFFDSYQKMNDFFINALGWEAGVEHLSQAKGASDYVLMVNPEKGMLMARGIAKCIASPENPLYNKEYARNHSFDLLTVRGLCPGDLLNLIFKNNWLPDACFPGSDNRELVHKYRDFIARCYLQIYYRGD